MINSEENETNELEEITQAINVITSECNILHNLATYHHDNNVKVSLERCLANIRNMLASIQLNAEELERQTEDVTVSLSPTCIINQCHDTGLAGVVRRAMIRASVAVK